MDSHEERTHYVKRVVLPSGKTIEVVYFQEQETAPGAATDQVSLAPETDQDLHVCLDCGSELVYPIEWREAGSENWSVLLHCPNCDIYREGVFSQLSVEAFDEALDRGSDALARDYKSLMKANMAEETERFVAALSADAILPEDF